MTINHSPRRGSSSTPNDAFALRYPMVQGTRNCRVISMGRSRSGRVVANRCSR